ncbi:hypothetical protein TWF696_008889 [Orbilia brochopaga]|uniref:Uncharacterized protein n=1 Tax=Orbilia brochopaga TaxID=3140254 RepID=A0AAV9UEJ4_9PEZI
MKQLLSTLAVIPLLWQGALAGPASKEFDWKNSKLDLWPMYLEETAQVTGYYQLTCWAARRGETPQLADTFGKPTGYNILDDCERSCRVNAWGELLLNPRASGACTQDFFLKLCIEKAQCKGSWVEKDASNTTPELPGARTDRGLIQVPFRQDMAPTMPEKAKNRPDPPSWSRDPNDLRRRHQPA